jgi:hypothetical protein
MFRNMALVPACATGMALLMAIAGGRTAARRKRPFIRRIPPDSSRRTWRPKTDRVNREIEDLEQEAMSQWRALPKNGGTAMRQVQLLGKIEMYNKNLKSSELSNGHAHKRNRRPTDLALRFATTRPYRRLRKALPPTS